MMAMISFAGDLPTQGGRDMLLEYIHQQDEKLKATNKSAYYFEDVSKTKFWLYV